MMSLSEQDVKRWFDVARKWGRADTPDMCRDTSECLQELSGFLHELLRCLEELTGNPPLILHTFPSVGKLLGQLYENCVILSSGEVFQAVVQCSVALSYSTTALNEQSVTKRAKSWAQTQLRRASTPALKNNNLLQIGEFWNYTTQETVDIVLDKLVSSLCHDLEVMRSYTWDTLGRDCYPQKPVSGLCLRELSELCLPLVTLPRAKPLVEKILCCEKSLDLVTSCEENDFSVTDSISPVFLKSVASSTRVDKGLKLSCRARVSLWKRYQPSFESEILDLIEISTVQRPYITRSQLGKIISSRDLPRPSVENPEFFAAAMSILSAFFVHSGGNSQAAKLMSIYGEMCVEACRTGSQQLVPRLCALFPDCVQPIVGKLSVSPRDLESPECVLHILQSVSQELDELRIKSSKSALFSIWQMLWCFPSWESKALRLSLTSCDKQVVDACVTVLCWYHCPPLSEDHVPLKESLGDILRPLRLLKSKTHLQIADVEYILSSSPVLRVARTASLLGSLLMVFLSEAVGGHLVFGDVVRMLTPGLTAIKRLSFVLNCCENSFLEMESPIKSSNDPRDDPKEVRSYLAKEINQLLQNAQQEMIAQSESSLCESNQTQTTNNSDSSSKDLVDGTEWLINVLQTQTRVIPR